MIDSRVIQQVMLELQARVDAGEPTGLTPEEIFEEIVDGLFPPAHGMRRCGTCVEFMRVAFYEGMRQAVQTLRDISAETGAQSSESVGRAEFFRNQVDRCGKYVDRHSLILAPPITDSRH